MTSRLLVLAALVLPLATCDPEVFAAWYVADCAPIPACVEVGT